MTRDVFSSCYRGSAVGGDFTCTLGSSRPELGSARRSRACTGEDSLGEVKMRRGYA